MGRREGKSRAERREDKIEETLIKSLKAQ